MKYKSSLCFLFSIILILCQHVHANDDEVNVLGKIKFSGDEVMGGRYISKDTYGMRANAVAMAIRANPTESFNYPINGFNSSKDIASSGDRDSVGLYVDNSSKKFSNWQVLSKVHYGRNFFKSILGDEEKIKPGMIIDTLHSPAWTTYVIHRTGDTVFTSGWVNKKTKKLGIPSDNAGLIVNPINKVWSTNFNLFLNKGGQSLAGVIQENGLVNNSLDSSSLVNGIDTVVLPSSTFGGTAAFLSRSAGSGFKQQWKFGFFAQGSSEANFYSADSVSGKSINAGFSEDSHANIGMIFHGNNKLSSVQWESKNKVISEISPEGDISKVSYKTKIIKSSSLLRTDYARYIVFTGKDITLTFPDKKEVSDGFTLQVFNLNGSNIVFKSHGEMINKSMHLGDSFYLIFQGGQWYVF